MSLLWLKKIKDVQDSVDGVGPHALAFTPCQVSPAQTVSEVAEQLRILAARVDDCSEQLEALREDAYGVTLMDEVLPDLLHAAAALTNQIMGLGGARDKLEQLVEAYPACEGRAHVDANL